MRTLLAVAALLPATLLLPGCPLACGGWEGQGDTVLRRGNGDAMILCETGGYAATLATGAILEGRYHNTHQVDGISASNGETGARVFTLATEADGSLSSPQLGAGWMPATLDQVELDHAHVQCADLEARPWFTSTFDGLPVATAFAHPTTGEHLLLCPDNTAVSSLRGPVQYTAAAGVVSIPDIAMVDAVYVRDTLVERSTNTAWTKVTGKELGDLRCQ